MNRNRVFMGMIAGVLAAVTGWTQQTPPAKTQMSRKRARSSRART